MTTDGTTTPASTEPSSTEQSDVELVESSRGGDTNAFAELWRRHSRAGRTVARSVTSSIDPDDLVSESFARIYQAINKGKGPTGAFRPYLFTTIRNTAAAWGRARRETSLDTLDSFEDPESSPDASIDALDRSLSARAFRSLPTRWQEVLWYTEIEQMTPAEVAPLLGMKANSVAALAYRAREGLREAWIQAHLKSVDDDSDHAFTIGRLGSYARGNLGARDTTKVEAHLDECARCTIVAAEAKDVGSRMALVLLPLVAGTAGALGYTAWLQTGAQSSAVAAAMPLTVTDGATVAMHGAGAAHGGAAATGLSATAGTGAGSGAGSGSGAAGGTAGGAGAGAAAGLSGGIIAAIVGGVIAAGTAAALVLGPMVFPAAPETDTSASEQTAPDPQGGTSVVPPVTAPTTAPTVPPASPAPSDPPATPKPTEPKTPVTKPTVAPEVPVVPVDPPVVPPVIPPVIPPTDPPIPPVLPPVALAEPSIDIGNGYVWPILSGTGALANAPIEVVAKDGSTVASTTADASGAWTVTVAGLPEGGGTLGARQTDPKTKLPSPVSVAVPVTTPAAPVLTGVSEGEIVLEGSSRTLVMQGVPGQLVRLTSGGTNVGAQPLQLDGSGRRELLVNFPGDHDRRVVLEYVDGNRAGPATVVNFKVKFPTGP